MEVEFRTLVRMVKLRRSSDSMGRLTPTSFGYAIPVAPKAGHRCHPAMRQRCCVHIAVRSFTRILTRILMSCVPFFFATGGYETLVVDTRIVRRIGTLTPGNGELSSLPIIVRTRLTLLTFVPVDLNVTDRSASR